MVLSSWRINIAEAVQTYSAIDGFNQALPSILGATNRFAANEMADASKERARVRTGFMRDHDETTLVTPLMVRVESKAEYSGYNEFGTRYMTAQPFFFDQITAVFIPVWYLTFNKNIRSHFGGGGRFF